jgi:lipopolysaccharide transport system ATP-binding protein
MSEVAIHVEGLGKRYQVGRHVGTYGRLTESLWRAMSAPFRRRDDRVEQRGHIWALRDLSLDIHQGDAVGIMGRNGAGKTTFLKMLSRITEPTEGRAEIHGRVGSLLEVGTGFHPELTGAENIYLNGAILGMKRSEIRRKFDEIVEFAEVQRYIDTPVKRYSSGMYVRLAFAVAAHLEPEVLIIDEVLAVGDVAFQKKCLGKIGDIAQSGRTVLFVSHNVGVVAQLCNRAVLLEKGEKVAEGPVGDVIGAYSRVIGSGRGSAGRASFQPNPDLECQILEITIRDGEGQSADAFSIGEAVEIAIEYEVRRPFADLILSLNLARNMVDVLHTFDTDEMTTISSKEPARYVSVHRLPRRFLKGGSYVITAGLGTPHTLFDLVDGALQFEIEEREGDTSMRGYRKERPGSVVSPGTWTTEVTHAAQSLSA